MEYGINLFRSNLLINIKKPLIWLVVFACAGCVNGILLTTPPDLQIAMNSAEKLRSEAEGRVKLVKIAEKQNAINLSDLQTIESSYKATQELFSSWIDNVQNDLRNKKIGSKAVDYNALSSDAANQAKQFNALVDDVLGVASRGDELETIKSFIKAGSELVKTIKEVEQAKRQELIAKLENLRWKQYQSI